MQNNFVGTEKGDNFAFARMIFTKIFQITLVLMLFTGSVRNYCKLCSIFDF